MNDKVLSTRTRTYLEIYTCQTDIYTSTHHDLHDKNDDATHNIQYMQSLCILLVRYLHRSDHTASPQKEGG